MAMTYLLKILTISTIVLGLAACGGAPGGAVQPTTTLPTAAEAPTTPPEPTGAPQPAAEPTATQPTATQPAQPTSVGDSAIVIYHKSGGIMGLDETLTVRADGTLVLESRGGTAKTAQVQPDQLDKLRELIASPEFAKLQVQYHTAGADQFTYDITVLGGSPGHVVTMDGVENPPVLDQLIRELNRLRRAM
jgi:Emfourin